MRAATMRATTRTARRSAARGTHRVALSSATSGDTEFAAAVTTAVGADVMSSPANGPSKTVRKRPILPWVFVGVLFLAAATAFILRQAEVMAVEKRLADAEQQIQYLTSMNESLEQQIEVLKSDEYIEKTAREKLGLVMPGEVQYMPIRYDGAKP